MKITESGYRKIFLVLLMLFFTPSLPAEETIRAHCTGRRVNVRAKPVAGSEIVTQLSFGEEVEVLDKGEEWTEIRAPSHSRCWVHSDYAEAGRITADSVNVRCGPGIAFPVLCQLDKVAGVIVVESAGDWIRIEPPAEFGVWVSRQYLEYPGAVEVAEVEVPEEVVEGGEIIEEEVAEAGVETEVSPARRGAPAAPVTVSVSPFEIPEVGLVSYAGTLRDLGVIINRPGTYKLTSNGKWVCILKSPTLDLNPYVNRVIRIEGVAVAVASTWDVPVIEVKRLQVIK